MKSTPENPPAFGLHAPPRQHNTTMERLPALNYSMLKESALRKRLAELGISSQGPRSLLERRHKEYITMWNANCDAARPKSRHDLLRQLDAWERTQGGKAPVSSRAVHNAAIIKDKDFDGSAWASQHNDSFKDLIASARNSSLQARHKGKEGDVGATIQPAEAFNASVGSEVNGSPELADNHALASTPEDVPDLGPIGDGHAEPGAGNSRLLGPKEPPEMERGQPQYVASLQAGHDRHRPSSFSPKSQPFGSQDTYEHQQKAQ